jgi:hypothetical protein
MIAFPAFPTANQEGVITHALLQALACPQKNAFSTPSAGVLRALPFDQNASFVGDSSRSRKFCLFLRFIAFVLKLLHDPFIFYAFGEKFTRTIPTHLLHHQRQKMRGLVSL